METIKFTENYEVTISVEKVYKFQRQYKTFEYKPV